MSNTHTEIQKLIRKHQEMKRVEEHLEKLTLDLEGAYDQMERLAKTLDKEYKDVQKLEKGSLKSLFYKTLGSKEKQLERERQEYLQVSLKYDEFMKSIELMEFEKEVLEKKYRANENVDEKIESLIKQRERELKQNNPKIREELNMITSRLDTITRKQVDFKKAIEIGKAAQDMLGRTYQLLRQARNWGNWDTWGKGKGAGYFKHSSIDKAKDYAYKAQRLLHEFTRHLVNIYGRREFDFRFHIESFNAFTDIFFDNLISDWIVQQKIVNALNNVASVKDKVTRTFGMILSDSKEIELEVRNLQARRRKLIVDS